MWSGDNHSILRYVLHVDHSVANSIDMHSIRCVLMMVQRRIVLRWQTLIRLRLYRRISAHRDHFIATRWAMSTHTWLVKIDNKACFLLMCRWNCSLFLCLDLEIGHLACLPLAYREALGCLWSHIALVATHNRSRELWIAWRYILHGGLHLF